MNIWFPPRISIFWWRIGNAFREARLAIHDLFWKPEWS